MRRRHLDHQIYMATDETAHPKSVFRMQHCYVHDANGGNNVKSRAERNEIYYNWIEGAQYHELELIGPDGQTEALAREDSDVVGNVLVKTATTFVARFGGDGTGQTHGRYRFVNNTVVTQPGGSAVFRLFDGIESVEMHNNVFWATGSGTVNLVRMVEATWKSGSAVIGGSANWYETGSTNAPSQWTGSLNGANPGFIDATTSDLRLTAGSPAIDKGGTTASPNGYAFPSPLGAPGYHPPLHTVMASGSAPPRPSVGAIDLGAFEYGTGTGGTGTGGTGTGGTGGTGGSAGSASGGSAGSAGAPSGGASGAVARRAVARRAVARRAAARRVAAPPELGARRARAAPGTTTVAAVAARAAAIGPGCWARWRCRCCSWVGGAASVDGQDPV